MNTNWLSHKTNILAGITVAMALVPEALAFAIVAGVHPLAGLFAVVIVAFITSTFGGRPGMVSAAAGSLAVVMAALVFAWQHAQKVMLDRKVQPDGKVIYHVHGPLFFASAHHFSEQFDIENDPECVKIDFKYSRVYDHSGVEAIDKLTERYQAKGKKLVLKHLSPECQALLTKAKDLVEVNVSEDPHYHVSMNR